MTLTAVAALLAAIGTASGVVFMALRFNREEAGRIVQQQTGVLTDMQDLYELTRRDRDELRDQVDRLRDRVDRLEETLRAGRDQLQIAIRQLRHRTEILVACLNGDDPAIRSEIDRLSEDIAQLEALLHHG